MAETRDSKDHWVISRDKMQCLIDALADTGYEVLGPVERDNTVVYRNIATIDDLPLGRVDEQDGGRYRLVDGDGQSLFAYVVGPDSWKQYLHPPAIKLFSAERTKDSFTVKNDDNPDTKFAFFGVRSCELQAIAIQDKVFLEGAYVDTHYQARRSDVFIVAINCARAGGTCFCASMDSGPRAENGFDLSLTEVADESEHYFVLEVGSERGQNLMCSIPHSLATEDQVARAENIVSQTTESMGRSLNTSGLKDLLHENQDHPRWDDVANKCLTCANCTMVCPTCFCTSVEDVTDLTGTEVSRWRKWDSCFTGDFSNLHGGSVRTTNKARYRQWMTHKLASWIDQFDTSGCVGCGRCITWCPVGIDITEEAAAIREDSDAGGDNHE